MRAVLTRVKSVSATVGGSVVDHVEGGNAGAILALVDVGRADAADAWETMARKIAELRILGGELSAVDADAPVLVASQFALMGVTKKGRRPSWVDAAPGPEAEPVIEKIVENLRNRSSTVATGQFGVVMEVASVNDGLFTIPVEY